MIILFVLLVTAASVLGEVDLEELCPLDDCVLPYKNFSAKPAPNIKKLTMSSDQGTKWLNLIPNAKRLEMFGGSDINLEDVTPLTNLRYMTIFGANISHLQNDMFIRMPNLVELILDSDSIETLTNGTFRNLSRLATLELKWNLIKVLPEGVFSPLTNLQYVDLSDNKISVITVDTFAHNRLTWLYLSSNPVTRLPLPAEIFTRLMDVVAVNNCPLLKSLQLPCDVDRLYLNNSAVKTLKSDKEIYKIRLANNALTHLDLRGSQSNEILRQNFFCEVPKLEWLDLSSTRMFYPMKGVIYWAQGRCTLGNLKFLNISNNQLAEFPSLLTPNLVTLDLSYNKLEAITGNTLKELMELQVLRLEGNYLKSFVYRSFSDAHIYLKELALYDNKFKSDLYIEILNYFYKKGVNLIQNENETVSSIY